MKWVCLALLVGCHAPTEVEPAKAGSVKGCLMDEHTPVGCCLVDGQMDCPDLLPPEVK